MVLFFPRVFSAHFLIKFSMHDSNLNSRSVSMSKLEICLFTAVLNPNFNTMDLVNFLQKNKIPGMSKRTSYSKNYRLDVRGRPPTSTFTPRTGFYRPQMWQCVRAGAGPREPTPVRTWRGRAGAGPCGRPMSAWVRSHDP
jgi:hypothetical protein